MCPLLRAVARLTQAVARLPRRRLHPRARRHINPRANEMGLVLNPPKAILLKGGG